MAPAPSRADHGAPPPSCTRLQQLSPYRPWGTSHCWIGHLYALRCVLPAPNPRAERRRPPSSFLASSTPSARPVLHTVRPALMWWAAPPALLGSRSPPPRRALPPLPPPCLLALGLWYLATPSRYVVLAPPRPRLSPRSAGGCCEQPSQLSSHVISFQL